MSMDYECSISGQSEEPGEVEEADGLDDMPVGWTQITMRKRVWNPKWLTLQQVKRDSIDALLAQVPDEHREASRDAVAIQVEANLHGLESSTPRYLIEDVTVYVSDAEAVTETLDEVRELLGISEPDDEDL